MCFPCNKEDMQSQSCFYQYFLVTLREVDTGNFHARIHAFEIFDIPVGWAKGTDNFGPPCAAVDALKNILEFDATEV